MTAWLPTAQLPVFNDNGFSATIADLYDPKNDEGAMPDNLRAAHARNDEVLERIYIGRRFKNDTERLEKLFEMYTQMTAQKVAKDDSLKPARKVKKAVVKDSLITALDGNGSSQARQPLQDHTP